MGKYFHKNKTKMNIPVCAAAVLLCLALVTTYFVSGLFARYAASGQGSDNARAAKFSVEGGGVFSQPVVADFTPGDFIESEFSVQNNSEVAVEYTIEVTNVTKNLPLQLSMGKESSAPAVQKNDITFTEQKLPGSHTDNYTLRIEWPEKNNDSTLMGKVDYILVTVTATQID